MLRLSLITILCSLVAPTVSQEYLHSSSDSIFDFTQNNANFSTLSTALQLADFDGVLDCGFSFCRILTVFAPTNEAFGALPEGVLARLTTPDFKKHLQNLLLYHITPEILRASDIEDGDKIRTLFIGETLNASVSDEVVKINTANVVTANVEASNGIIHAIDKVLIPDFLSKDVIEIADEVNNFSTLLAAVDAAGLTSTLKGFQNITLFAPTDAAFEKLGSAVVADLLEDLDTLTSILTYHVVEGVVLSTELEVGNVTTIQGENISVEETRELFFFHRRLALNGKVHLVTTDILASNGIIHVIEDVLIPPSVTPPTPTIAEIAAANSDLTTLVEALGKADLVDALSGEGPFTVFAPTNAAFSELGNALVSSLLEDQDTLIEILTYHVVEGTITSDDLEEGQLTTLQGGSIDVDEQGFWIFKRTVLNDGIRFEVTDITASNGVIHLIDGVLLPPNTLLPSPAIVDIAVSEPKLSTLTKFLQLAGLVETLEGDGPFTVFAPTDYAFSKLGNSTLESLMDDNEALKTILLYHVVSGNVKKEDLEEGVVTTLSGATIDVEFHGGFFGFFGRDVKLNGNAEVTTFDILGSNGVIHLIDEVLLPPDNIVTVAASNGFNTLIAAIAAANLTSVLQGEGPFTIFAPTDAAFDKLPSGTLDSLLADPATLARILQYHVISGRIESGDLKEGAVATLEGQNIDVDFQYIFFFFLNGIVLNGESEVITTDIKASNGIIHSIDEVLIPPDLA
mmetsp:Transcript_32065/g.45579  ORF Transcript_32065/g.45579 Transcript_32065/m.45579 type:complete len:740 (-) Transcript_32065:422-2641(-)|eukprot:CAMPEP_0202455930 /NCGR_PEP_ID=MMETSP1360-20130828/13330_1 /ASSEMBLY_ACC=CAM_ASM_000848 /TAXON_ID=515479 /ORGANISM="Licmophora paradoxa, Strain CCMP2313" /LENGTH=739 /DNA_ID=CAMNT_0049075623 /DNA_START=528 /DNA_END=2747 /DNA_ORIENTATION=+